jgi:hypothetical protein
VGSIIHVGISLAVAATLVWWAMRGPMSSRTRLVIGVLSAFIGVGDLLIGEGAHSRMTGVIELLTAYIVLMPFFPWKRVTPYASARK